MKNTTRIITLALVCLLILGALAACAPKTDNIPTDQPTENSGDQTTEAPIAGGYSEDRDVTEDDLAIFNEAMAGLVGVEYTPVKVSTQVVAGMNYRFTCTAKAVTPDAVEETKTVNIFKPLDGPAELVDIV